LYRLKYRGDQTVIGELVEAIEGFLKMRQRAFDAIIPVPPSVARANQPVMLVAAALGTAKDSPLYVVPF
jgi:hypothetical protein